MKKRNWSTWAWVLASLLILAAIGISYGRSSSEAKPTIDNFGPSGSAAFATLLRNNGYSVRNMTAAFPNVRGDEIVIAFVDDTVRGEDEQPIFEHFNQAASKGTKLLLLPLDRDFKEASAMANVVKANSPANSKTISLKVRETVGDVYFPGQEQNAVQLPLWIAEPSKNNLAYLRKVRTGYEVVARDGLVATNRFIDQEQNATFLMDLVRKIGGKSRSIAFAEGLYNPTPPSLFDVLGRWSESAWWQLVFLFVVIVYSLGKRFGLPDEPRPVQTGQRELVNAVADTYRRANAAQIAARAIYDHADRKLRKALKLSSEMTPHDRDASLPPSLSQGLRKLNEAAMSPLGAHETFLRSRNLRLEMSSFLRKS